MTEAIVYSIEFAALAYLACAFIGWDFNPNGWKIEGRIAATIVICCWAVMGAIMGANR